MRDADTGHHVSDVDGLRVVSEHVPGVRSVSIGIWIGTGSRDEQATDHGYAHFVEHLLFKGNERYGAEAISTYFDGIGSDVNAATTKEYTVVHSRVLDRHVSDAFELFANMVLAPAFEPDDLDAERQVILEEIAMYNDSPSDVVHELADELVFDGHPLGTPIVGTVASIEQATAASVATFHGSHYIPSSIVVSAAGSCDHDAIIAHVRERLLPVLDAGRPAMDRAHGRLPAAVTDGSPRARARYKDTEQVHVCLAGRGVSRRDPRRYVGAVLDTILGSTPSSRLFSEVRERRGLAYSIYSFTSHYSDTGQVGVYVAVRPDRMLETLTVVGRELDAIRAQPPSADELARAKDHLEGRMLLSMESTTVRGNRLGASLVTDMPIEPVDLTVERIRQVTPQAVRELAAELYNPGNLAFAAVAEDTDTARETAIQALGIDASLFDIAQAVAQ